MKNLRKRIAYAYPTSIMADYFQQHGYYIEQYYQLEDGSWCEPHVAQGCDVVFDDNKDPDLYQLLSEADGTICPMYARLQALTD
jgi:hypothetical protein